MMRGRYLFLFLFILPLAAQESGGDWESFRRDGVLVEELLSDGEGRPLQSRFYEEGLIREVRTYSYGDRIQTVDVRRYGREGGDEAWQEILYLREDGSVRKSEKTEGDRTVVAGWSERTEWTRGGGSQEVLVYGKDGEIRERVLFGEEGIREEEYFSYSPRGSLLFSELIRSAAGERIVTAYTDTGRPGEILSYKKGLLASEVRYTYNERDLLVREERRGEGLLAERSLAYGPGGEVREELFFRNGLLARKVLYDGEERTEEIYSKGRLTLRVLYRGTEMVSEEKIQ